MPPVYILLVKNWYVAKALILISEGCLWKFVVTEYHNSLTLFEYEDNNSDTCSKGNIFWFNMLWGREIWQSYKLFEMSDVTQTSKKWQRQADKFKYELLYG